MVLSRKQVLVLAGVVLLLVAVSVGYQYHGRWHGNRAQPQGKAIPQTQGKAILDPPLQDLLLPLDTVIEKKMTWHAEAWSVFFETGADWDTLYEVLDRYFLSKDFEPDAHSGLGAARWDSPDRRFFVMLAGTTPVTGIPENPGEVPSIYRYGIMLFFENPVKPKLPSPEEEEP